MSNIRRGLEKRTLTLSGDMVLSWRGFRQKYHFDPAATAKTPPIYMYNSPVNEFLV